MLDDYKSIFSNAYEILNGELINNKVSHAYLIDENFNSNAYDFVLSFVKSVFCVDVTDSNQISNICKRIDDGNFPEFIVIEPEGLYIKKQRIIDLQNKCSLVSVESNRRVYIIRDCDKMRAETANSLLKFLEEPDNNIIAILMTNNYNNVLPTLISRCQCIKLAKDVDVDNNCLNEENEEYADKIFNFIEKDGINAIYTMKEIVNSLISLKDRDKIVKVLESVVDRYYKLLNSYVNKDDSYDVESITYKINCLNESINYVKSNVNLTLVFDYIIVNVGGYDEISRY